MRSVSHSGTKVLGLVALIASGSLVMAADGATPSTVDWSGGTTFANKDGGWKIQLGAKLEAYGYYFDQDEAVNRDAVLREWTAVNAGTDNAVKLARATTIWTNTNTAWADGMSIDDAELGIKGSHKNVVFGLLVDFADATQNGVGAADKLISEWYLGIDKVPLAGEVTFGFYDPKSYIGAGNLYDDDVTDVFESPDMIGVQAKNSFMNKMIGYELRVGTISGTAWGKKDGNWDLDGSLWANVLKQEDLSVMLMANIQLRNADTTAHNPFSSSETFSVSYEQGPRLVQHSTHADDTLVWTLSGDVTWNALCVGASYGMASTNVSSAPQYDPTGLIATGSVTYTERKDATFAAMQVYAEYTLTGEKQKHGGGVSAPKADFAWDGSGFGAIDLVARFAVSDLQDNSRDGVTINRANPTAGLLQSAIQKEEGGEVTEITGGANWYLTKSLLLGLYVSQANWTFDDGVTNDPNASGGAAGLLPTFTSTASLIEYSYRSGIENDYDATAMYFRGWVKF